ncbi:MAG: hypothetical protein ACC658_10150 [Acidimicrobiia bacterium]
MRNRTTMIVVLALFALVVATVPAALAAQPDFCNDLSPDYKPGHPSCLTTEPPTVQRCETVTTLRGTGNLEFGCDWTPVDISSTTGIVTVKVIEGKVSSVAVFVRDSAPGDICVLEQWDKPDLDVLEASFPLVHEGQSYWDGGTHWCEPFDPIVGERDDLNGEPLHVFVSVRAKKGTVVEVTLTPGQAE